MNRLHPLVLGCLLLASTLPAAEPEVIPLWPEGVPNLRPDAGPEKVIEGPRYTNIHFPTLLVYRPEHVPANGTAILYAPGGGYVRVALGGARGGEAGWLNDLGVTVFVLKYRHADYGHPAPLQDILRALRIIRSRTADFGLRPDRIGVMGGSAGGHLSACAATMWDDPAGLNGAPLDSVSARPDFAILIYPVITMTDPFAHKGSREALLGKTPAPALIDQLSIEKRVRQDMPPVFIAATMADKSVPVENSLMLYQALRDAGVPAEMHVYAQGSHGNSHDPQYGPTALWPKRVEEWLRFNGWLPSAPTTTTP
jgi:acetyl esterase/lipase